ncbi:MAG: NAD(P)/FAD-dependent oxidoreductase [Phycisphaerales bacterium]
MSARARRVVIVGGGFAGLACAKALRHAPVDVTLVDRRNHHVFQPLLYQVATAALSPAQIAAPIRAVLRGQRNTRVVLGDVTAVDAAGGAIALSHGGGLAFDYLVLAAGAAHSYFGHDDWSRHAPGLKSIEDALEIRRRFLLAFEEAERTPDPELRAALLTFVIVGAGPTGVELAGAFKEIALTTIRRDFRSIDTRDTRVVLVEAMDRVLPSGFPGPLSDRALRDLRAMGVDVRLLTRVTHVDGAGVTLEAGGASSRIAARNVLWAAGVRASGLGASLGVPLDRAGRVVVRPDLSVPGYSCVFVAGDLAHASDQLGVQVPGMAPGAMQMGAFVGRIIMAEVTAGGGGSAPARPAFRYVDKGTLATIGRARAVAHVMGGNFGGFPAWLFWVLLHIAYLISFRAKLLVFVDWVWSYVTFGRGARLITGGTEGESRTTLSP